MMKTTIEKLSKDWSDTWSRTNILREIGTLKRDQRRPYVLKYLPRNGVHLEAGCGLGRYVYYLSDLGFDIVGLDISESGLRGCKKWAEENGYNPDIFKYGDVREIPYPDNHFSSYLSFGVIEHFEEGPHKALKEAYRVLRPGGIAIISTPNKYSYSTLIYNAVKKLKSIIVGTTKEFYEYEYSVDELANFIKRIGFKIIEKQYICLKWPMYNLSRLFPGGLRALRLLQPFVFPILDFMEKTPLKSFSSGSLVVAVKLSNKPYCFFCGSVFDCNSNHDIAVPLCEKCAKTVPEKILSTYKKKNICYNLRNSYRFDELQLSLDCEVKKESCFFCGESYNTNKYFGDYGFSVHVCPKCLKKSLINQELSNFHLKYAWFEM